MGRGLAGARHSDSAGPVAPKGDDYRCWSLGSLGRAFRSLGAISVRAGAVTAQVVNILAVLQKAGANWLHVHQESWGQSRAPPPETS